jgi:glycosyltransferase involved in cell wall biosynthesis
MMQENYGRDSIVLPMPCPGPNEHEYKDYDLKRNDSHRILWIGKIYKVKRPDRLLDLAQACPELHFDIVGPSYDSEYATKVCQRAKTIPNLTMHGPISRDRVSEFYKKSTVMCCTSDSEGFPNTFLEAWSYGLPILTTFDPDNIIAEKGLGATVQDVKELADVLRALCSSSEKLRKLAMKARQFYLDNYTVDAVMAKFEKVFIDVYKN